MAETVSGASAAIVTASHAADFDRCALLCETMDRHVSGHRRHLILVAHGDVARFRPLASARREIIDERDILPSWLRDLPDPLSLLRRRLWLSPFTAPLRGWHVQQLRRIAIAAHVDERMLVYCDSDVVFLKPFDCASMLREGRTRLFRRDGRLLEAGHTQQIDWSRQAGRVLGLGADTPSQHDYISTLIAWDAGAVRAMCGHIEQSCGRHWISAIARSRRFSECMIYGRYVDDVTGAAGHFHDDTELCRVYWTGPAMDEGQMRSFLASLAPTQVAVGLQSFIGMDIGGIRRLVVP